MVDLDDAFTPLRLIAFECRPMVMPDHSEPEPDLMLLRLREGGYAASPARRYSTLVEVSLSTLGYDLVKMLLYAAAGVPEAWLVNLRDGWVESNTQPTADGYLTTRRYALGDTIAPQAFPDLAIPVERIIPPSAEDEGELILHPYSAERGGFTITPILAFPRRGGRDSCLPL